MTLRQLNHAKAAAAVPSGLAQPGPSVRAPTVVYIAGSGRSGSTILERALGEMACFVNVGELIDLFRRVAPRAERCGCGLIFPECPFWAAVGAQAFGGWEPQHVASVHDLQRRIARQRHLPQLLALPHSGRRFRGDLARYGQIHASLYRAIAAQAGAAHIVDASKWPVQALALARAGIDVRVIHLVRDLRGVVYSLTKQDVTRPHTVHETDLMWHYSPANAAFRWALCQSETELLRRCGLPVTRMHYEDFIRQPQLSMEKALTGLGLPPRPPDLAHIRGRHIVLGRSHGLSGNPSRFQEGDLRLRADEEWRSRMPARDRRIVTAIGLPHLVRYRQHAAGPAPAKGVPS
jgi:hypothetical protein